MKLMTTQLTVKETKNQTEPLRRLQNFTEGFI